MWEDIGLSDLWCPRNTPRYEGYSYSDREERVGHEAQVDCKRKQKEEDYQVEGPPSALLLGLIIQHVPGLIGQVLLLDGASNINS
jgi:hypothetical protein